MHASPIAFLNAKMKFLHVKFHFTSISKFCKLNCYLQNHAQTAFRVILLTLVSREQPELIWRFWL